MPNADEFRHALKQVFRDREAAGASAVTIISGDFHRQLGGYPAKNHAMPTCCNVLKAEMAVGDEVLEQPPQGRGAALAIRYRLPRPNR